jgi:hypothetical protein
MTKWDQLADEATIKRTLAALQANGFAAQVVTSGEEAKASAIALISESTEVMTMTSMTLEAITLTTAINESGRYTSVRKKLLAMDHQTQGAEMRRHGAAPDVVIGSVHAITEKGQVLIASMSGSQLPAYVYGAGKVIWVVGTQKLVKTLDDGLARLEEHSLPLEDERLQKAYGMGSSLNKMVIINKEIVPGRISIILVKEKLGF